MRDVERVREALARERLSPDLVTRLVDPLRERTQT
jgi:hypothetical protein